MALCLVPLFCSIVLFAGHVLPVRGSSSSDIVLTLLQHQQWLDQYSSVNGHSPIGPNLIGNGFDRSNVSAINTADMQLAQKYGGIG